MKSVTFYILLIIGLSLSAICRGAPENPNVGTSFQSVTTPPSANQRRRLITSPNPLNAGSNSVVTGNVGGLRYFRGVVPYGSQYYSGADLGDTGTDSVSSFLRRSTDPILSDRNPGRTRVYYEPRRTVSSFYIQNGQRTAISETTPRAQPRNSPISLPNLLDNSVWTEDMQRPLSSNNQELDKILSRQFELREKAKKSARQTLQKENEEENEFKNFFEITLEPEDYERPITEQPVTKDLLQEPEQESETEADPTEIIESETVQQAQQLREQQRQREQEERTANEDLPIRRRFLEEEADTDAAEDEQPDKTEDGISMEAVRERAIQHAEAERIRGEHETLESLAEARFSNYMQAAETFMRNGQFYRAADTYSLAAIWKPEDPRSYAGQAFALFAAGEYMSSAYYLSRAIELEPAIAAKKYDLAALSGDRDVFENRFIELATWQQRSDSGELAFLMAYILYQDGKGARAASAIQRAEEHIPDSQATAILKDVIIPGNRTAP